MAVGGSLAPVLMIGACLWAEGANPRLGDVLLSKVHHVSTMLAQRKARVVDSC